MTLVLQHRLHDGARIYYQNGKKTIALVVDEINIGSVGFLVTGVPQLKKISLKRDQKREIVNGLEIVLVDVINYNNIKCGYNADKDFDIKRWDYAGNRSLMKKEPNS